MVENWKSDLGRWLTPFICALRHKTRARMCPAYIAGLVNAKEQSLIQELIAHASVEAFAEAVLHGLAGRDVMPRHLAFARLFPSIPPAESEARYYAQVEEAAKAA